MKKLKLSDLDEGHAPPRRGLHSVEESSKLLWLNGFLIGFVVASLLALWLSTR